MEFMEREFLGGFSRAARIAAHQRPARETGASVIAEYLALAYRGGPQSAADCGEWYGLLAAGGSLEPAGNDADSRGGG